MSSAPARWRPALRPAPAVESGEGAGPGDVLAGYHLLEEIGRGGMARVFRAEHVHPGRDGLVAVKVVHPEWSGDDRVQSQFGAEIQLAVAVRHPCVVRTFEAGFEDGRLFIAMEWVRGISLAELLCRARGSGFTMPLPVKLFIVGEVLKGLAHLHELTDADDHALGAAHHDVTPGNVLLSCEGEVKLADFGIASFAETRRTRSQMISGKPGYFAPEQLARGGNVDQRADIFAAGVLMCEILTGRRLFSGPNEFEDNERVRLPRLDLPAALAPIVRRALRKNPKSRYPTARAMLTAVADALPPPAEGRTLLAQLLTRQVPAKRRLAGVAAVPRQARTEPRLLLVAGSAERAQLIEEELGRWGGKVLFAPSPNAAVALAERRTFHAMVVDTDALSSEDAAEVGTWFRALPGMGHQPVVYLGAREADDGWRSRWLPRNTPPSEVVTTVRGLLDRMGRERSFVRYPLDSPAILFLGGRSHDVRLVDISRNGMAIRGGAIPAESSSVWLATEIGGRPWRAQGMVTRVVVESPGSALVGVALVRIDEDCEAALISLIAGLQ